MTDWEQLREVGHNVSPPPFESLVTTAGKRDRRARVVTATATLSVLAALGVGLGLVNDDDGLNEPAQDPSRWASVTTEESPLPDGVLTLPEQDAGDEYVSLDAGRYRIPLNDTLAFDVDLPDETAAHDHGLFLSTEDFVLKTEVAGDEYGVPRHPCTAQQIDPVGPTVDDLVRAIGTLPVYRLTRPEPVTLGGADGAYVEARIPRTYDASQCDGGAVQLPGNPATAVSGAPPYIGRWWILDVDGQRVVVQQNCWGCPARHLDRAPRTVQSITFTLTR